MTYAEVNRTDFDAWLDAKEVPYVANGLWSRKLYLNRGVDIDAFMRKLQDLQFSFEWEEILEVGDERVVLVSLTKIMYGY